jgi:arsenate reductase-like glutaredoxin family protein
MAKEVKEKPLDRMTAKELREIAVDIAEITGAHGMNKEELLVAVKKARGIVEETTKKKGDSVRKLKQNIRTLKAKKMEAVQEKDAEKTRIFRRRISRLKKKTRRDA